MGATDCHVHIAPIDEMFPATRAMLAARASEILPFLEDPHRFLELLDHAGVERAVLINYLSPRVIGYTERTNDFVSAYVRADPDRLIAVGGIDPDHPEPAREVRRLVQDLGIRGLKLHPPHQLFFPDDYASGTHPGLREIYRTAEELRVPIVFHTGTSVFPKALNRYGEPLRVEQVAVDFPDLTIVLAHAGRPLWMEEAVFLARRFPNVWLELSGIPPNRLLAYLPRLPDLAAKSIFGSDWPGPGVKDLGANFAAFRALGLTPDALRAILDENPLRVYPRR